MPTEQVDIDRARGFISDLEEAEAIYRRLLSLTRNQSEVLRTGVSPELLELVRAKEEELARLAKLESRMGPARTAWVELKERISGELRAEVQAVVGRVEAILRELLQTEEAEGKCLAEKREETLAQIRRIDSARKVRGAYGEKPSVPALLDQKE
jgi:hypothetical protein